MSTKKLVFTGGGTAGHVYPAMAVIEQLKKKEQDWDILWIGQHDGMERPIVERANLRYAGIHAGKLRRYISLQNFLDIFKVIAGFFGAMRILAKERPRLVFSKGGFVSVPVVWAASLLRIPVFIHESDSDSGLANRLASGFAQKIFVPYEETKKSFSPKVRTRIFVSGNPIREQFLHADPARARAHYQLGPQQPFILVLGGSSGSQQVNELVLALLPSLPQDCFVLHQMGDKLFKESQRSGYVSVPFIHEGLPDLIAASTLVISRSGAGSVWELAILGALPIFIPLGQRGDQVRNAALIESKGGCISLPGAQATSENLKAHVLELLGDQGKRSTMQQAIKAIVKSDASVYLADEIREIFS